MVPSHLRWENLFCLSHCKTHWTMTMNNIDLKIGLLGTLSSMVTQHGNVSATSTRLWTQIMWMYSDPKQVRKNGLPSRLITTQLWCLEKKWIRAKRVQQTYIQKIITNISTFFTRTISPLHSCTHKFALEQGSRIAEYSILIMIWIPCFLLFLLFIIYFWHVQR